MACDCNNDFRDDEMPSGFTISFAGVDYPVEFPDGDEACRRSIEWCEQQEGNYREVSAVDSAPHAPAPAE